MADKTVKLKISGMTEDHSVETVLAALSAVPGAKFADVSVKDNTATVEYDDTAAAPGDFASAVDEAGYGAELA